MFNLEVKYLNIIEALPTSTHIFQDPSKIFEKFRKFQVLVSWKCCNKNKLIAVKRDLKSRDWKTVNFDIGWNNDTEISSL